MNIYASPPHPPLPFTDIHCLLFTLDFTVGYVLWPLSFLFDAQWNQLDGGSPKHSKVDEFILPQLYSSTMIQKKAFPKTGKSQNLQHFRLQSQCRLIQSIQESYVLQCTWIFSVCVWVFFFFWVCTAFCIFFPSNFLFPSLHFSPCCLWQLLPGLEQDCDITWQEQKKKKQIEKNRSTNSEVPSGRGNLK